MTFDSVSYEEWIKKVKKELKLESLDGKSIDFGYGVKHNPFFEREPYGKSETNRIEQTWLIGESFDARIVKNEDILSSLQGGVQSIHIRNLDSSSELDKLLHNVLLDLVELHIENPTDPNVVLQNLQALFRNSQKPLGITFRSASSVHEVHPWIEIPKVIELNLDKETTLADSIREAIEYIENSNKSSWSQVVDSIVIKTNVLAETIKHTAFIESFRKLWWNVCNSFDESFELPTIEQHVYPDESLDRDTNFIYTSVATVNAVISNCDRLILHPKDEDRNSAFVQRINRNMQHLLQMESFMQKSAFAYRGSYTIEEISNKISRNVWESL